MKNRNHRAICLFAGIICLGMLISCGKGDRARDSEKPVPQPAASAQSTQQSAPVPDIFQAALNGDTLTVRRALHAGVSANVSGVEGRTPLMLAAFNGNVKVLNMLLQAGAKTDERDVTGRTALMYASTGPYPDAVSLLLKNGADVNFTDNQEKWTALMFAAAEGQMDVVRLLIEHKADPNLKDVDGDNAAAFAQQKGHGEIAAYLKGIAKR